jgi:hypothetical protein
MNTYDYNIQELLDTTQRPKLRIHRVEEDDEIHTKGIRNQFSEIIAENSLTLCSDIDTHL